jgi:Major Facilitator Superfamily
MPYVKDQIQSLIPSDTQNFTMDGRHSNFYGSTNETMPDIGQTITSDLASHLDIINISSESGDDSDGDQQLKTPELPLICIAAIVSTAFSYGCILTTLFLITLPIECERIHASVDKIPKSVILGIFVALAGVTQLVSPLIGRASDNFEPPRIDGGGQVAELGQRLPFYMLGAGLAVTGLFGQMLTSYSALWVRYGFSFIFSMVGLNIQYAMMLALIPDQVPHTQTGVANGLLAQLLVTGSIFGFALFHLFITHDDIGSMYGLYASIVILSSIMTGSYAHDRDAELAAQRMQRKSVRILENSAPVVLADVPFAAPSPKHWPMKARRATKRVVTRAVQKAKQIVLTPTLICTSLLEPFRSYTWSTVLHCYTIDVSKHHGFFIVTLSRLFYYCGMSVQTFFLYFLHDVIHVKTNPEAAVAILAIAGQCSAACTCYPVGLLSDHVFEGRRTPFVHVSCAILAIATISLVFATTFRHIIFLCLILGAANGVYLTAETSLAVDTLSEACSAEPDDESGSAQLLGIWGLAAFLGSALGPLVGSVLLSVFGTRWTSSSTLEFGAGPLGTSSLSEVDNDAEEYSLAGYAVIVSLSAFYFFCSSLMLRFLNHEHG